MKRSAMKISTKVNDDDDDDVIDVLSDNDDVVEIIANKNRSNNNNDNDDNDSDNDVVEVIQTSEPLSTLPVVNEHEQIMSSGTGSITSSSSDKNDEYNAPFEFIIVVVVNDCEKIE